VEWKERVAAAFGLSIPAASNSDAQETVNGVSYLVDDQRQNQGQCVLFPTWQDISSTS
jgi:hypothetical protein